MDELKVELLEARYLAGVDIGGLSDPYCRVSSNFNKQKFKTKTIHKTLTPRWNETFTFYPDERPPTGAILIHVFDKNHILKDEKLGEIVVDVSQYVNGASHDLWLGLQNEPKKKAAARGEVHVKVLFRALNKSNLITADSSVAPNSSAMSEAKMEDQFILKEELGRGAFAIVYKGISKTTNEAVAIKIINKLTIKPKDLQMLSREIKIMKKLQHPNIVQLYDVFETGECLYLVMEVMAGGELFDQIIKRGHYNEDDARRVIEQILVGVEYMHNHGVVHRDLKPENLLCNADGETLKIGDFGMSKDVAMGNLQTSVGSPNYIAPEVLLGGQYGSECDMWSIGVITYVLLCGFTPFYGENQKKMFEQIVKANFDFPPPEWSDVSAEAMDLIKQLLVANPTNRLTAKQALGHPWIQNKSRATSLQAVKRNLSKTRSQHAFVL